jgi:hypothetical protein
MQSQTLRVQVALSVLRPSRNEPHSWTSPLWLSPPNSRLIDRAAASTALNLQVARRRLGIAIAYDHYSLLRSIEDLFGLDPLGHAAGPSVLAFGKAVYNAAG